MKTPADMTARLSQPHSLTRSHKGFFIAETGTTSVVVADPSTGNPVVLVEQIQGPPGGGPLSVSGTGFVHVTAGALDPSARAVNLVSTDVVFQRHGFYTRLGERSTQRRARYSSILPTLRRVSCGERRDKSQRHRDRRPSACGRERGRSRLRECPGAGICGHRCKPRLGHGRHGRAERLTV